MTNNIVQKNTLQTIVVIAILILLFFPFFHKLGVNSIFIWDESRTVNNTIEMMHNHDYLVKHFNGEPDKWSTKPPLTVWAQIISCKIFGINEFGMRFPSALAGYLTSIILGIFAFRILRSKFLSIFAPLILATTFGYVSYHVTRTADNDALMILWTTIGSLSFFSYSETGKNHYLHIGFLALALGVLTKSVAALFFTPGIFIYLLWRKKIMSLLKNKHLYFSLFSFILIVLSYYLIRETQDHGYIKAVFDNEIFRFSSTIESHAQPFDFYIRKIDDWFAWWYILLLIAPIVAILTKPSLEIKNFTIFSYTLIITFLLLISCSKTKLPWYPAPSYPLMAISTGIAISSTLEYFHSKKYMFYLLLSISVSVWLFRYTKQVQQVSYKNNPKNGIVDFGYLVRKLPLNNYFVFTSEYNAPTWFYVKKDQLAGKKANWIEIDSNNKLTYGYNLNSFNKKIEPGDTLFACSSIAKERVKKSLNVKIIAKQDPCEIYILQTSDN